jgi:hypothetical protein
MRKSRRWAVAALLAAVAGAPARATAATGEVVGHVYDQTGLPLRGIKVVLSHERPPAQAGTTYTNAEGWFAFRALLPGRYWLKASAPKIKTLVQRNLQVKPGPPLELSLVMEVQTTVEEVRVLEKAPLVSTTRANVKESYDLTFVEGLIPMQQWGKPRAPAGMNTEA